MDHLPLEELERQLASVRLAGAPAALRGDVLSNVQRELRAARWDRRLAQAATLLLLVGIGLNAAIAWRPKQTGALPVAARPTDESLIRLAVNVAEVTDAQTGRRYARHMATLAGRDLSGEEAAAIEAAVRGPDSPAVQHDVGFNEG